MPAVDVLLDAIATDPSDDIAWTALADCLEEQDKPAEAELVRLREWLRHASWEHPERKPREARLQELLAAGVLPAVPRLSVPLTKRKSLTLALIPAGSFLMGSPEDEPERSPGEGPRHRVTLTRPFWLGVHPVTQSQWTALGEGGNPSSFRGAPRPVERVSWDECQEYCRKLSEKTGRRFRLPTEAEWEYACRAGTTTTFHTGNGEEAMRLAGWCSTGLPDDPRQTHPVGLRLPNAWGLYDMHGNVREWCADGLRDYTEEPVVDPCGVEVSNRRVVRGGSWHYDAEDSRAASRYDRPRSYQLSYYGLRVLAEWG
jgi:uncharacterized protein (TIGR02996 family)